LKTGEVVATRTPDQDKYTLGFGHHRCYRNKATTKYLIHGRSGVEFLDVAEDRAVADHWVRGACQYGILPANGLVYAPSHSCACYVYAKLNGFNALSGQRATQLSETPNRLQRLLPLPPGEGRGEGTQESTGQTHVSPATSDLDWPTYRRDAARSGATPAPLSPHLGPRWQHALPGPLTAVVVSDGTLYVAQREAHTLHALDADDGSPRWQFTAAGRIDSPPTVLSGRVYFGSADGHMYCLRAEDGALAWRFRVAPEPRQIVAYGQLESVWPLHGNVLVCEDPQRSKSGVAYAVAGRTSYVDGGLFLCGVDAVTGDLLVNRRISHRDPETGLQPQDTVRGTHMPGTMPDVLSTDGESLFMRHTRLDFQGESLPEDVDHLFTSAGFVDDSWWHRSYWQLGRAMGGGYGGWTSAGKRSISGRILVKDGNRVFGFGRKDYAITGSHLGMQSEYHLYAANVDTAAAPQAPRDARRGKPAPKWEYGWSQPMPFLVRAMVLAGRTLFIAGPAEVGDLQREKPEGSVSLWAVSVDDGSKLAEYELNAVPVFDSFAVAGNGLYFTTVDGQVVCYREQAAATNATASAEDDGFRPLFNGKDLSGWVPVNTAPSTWSVADGMIVCSGQPIGEIRTERMYQNFILELEWRHMKPRGNAGVFVWADDITAPGQPFHRAVEVQVLENAYGNSRGHTTHGDIFPIHGANMVPINGRGGSRAFPTENRSLPSPQWNHYRIVCQDGTISLAVNGKIVTRGKEASPRKGYICLESEGGIVHYRGLRIKELPDTPVDPQHVAIADRGYRCLYTGVDLSGWKTAEGERSGWRSNNWVLSHGNKPAGDDGAITSDAAFGGFGFIFDVRCKEGSHVTRVLLRGSDKAAIAIDPDDPTIGEHLAKPGRWNRFEGRLEGSRLTLRLNGHELFRDRPLDGVSANGPIRIVPGGPIDFANIYVHDLE